MIRTEPRSDAIKEFFLEANPNPERIGCPPEQKLQMAAENRLALNDPARLHLAECSECFAEFRGYKLDWEEKQRGRQQAFRWAISAGLLVALAGGAIAARHHGLPGKHPDEIATNLPPKVVQPATPDSVVNPAPSPAPRPSPPQREPITRNGGHKQPGAGSHQPGKTTQDTPNDKPETPSRLNPSGPPEHPVPAGPVIGPVSSDSFVTASLDLSHAEKIGGDGTRAGKDALRLAPASLNLLLLLPDSAQPGSYEIRLAQDADGQKELVRATGVALLSKDGLRITVRLPLAGQAPGDYYLIIASKSDGAVSSYPLRIVAPSGR